MPELLSWDRCRELCGRVLDALDWAALGRIYFHEDGEQELLARRSDILDMGLEHARELHKRVGPKGTSLHVGAGLAELVVMIAEVVVRDRSVRAVNLRSRECELINHALKRHQLSKQITLEAVDARAAAEQGGYDHLSCVSLFTDPETWPMMSAVSYGRIAPIQVDVDQFVRERTDALQVASALFAGMQRPGWITTTVEELSWFLRLAGEAGVAIEPDDIMLPTALVGDPVGFVRVGA